MWVPKNVLKESSPDCWCGKMLRCDFVIWWFVFKPWVVDGRYGVGLHKLILGRVEHLPLFSCRWVAWKSQLAKKSSLKEVMVKGDAPIKNCAFQNVPTNMWQGNDYFWEEFVWQTAHHCQQLTLCHPQRLEKSLGYLCLNFLVWGLHGLVCIGIIMGEMEVPIYRLSVY